jgi:cytochrome c-type biogenesis protein CcmH
MSNDLGVASGIEPAPVFSRRGDQLAEGHSPEEVKAYFIARYGEWVLLEPDPRGFNLFVYIVPVLGLLFGGGLVAMALRRWTRPAE